MWRMLGILLMTMFLAGPIAQVNSTADMNALIDQLLILVRQKIGASGKNVIPLEKIEHEFTFDLKLAKIYGSVGCGEGQARALTTVYRTGEASGEIFHGNLTVQAPLGLKYFHFAYEKCSLVIKNILTFSTPLEGTIGNNSIDLGVMVSPVGEEGLKATLTTVELIDLSSITIVTGTSLFDRIKNEIANSLVWRFHSLIFRGVKSVLAKFEGMQFDLPTMQHLAITP